MPTPWTPSGVRRHDFEAVVRRMGLQYQHLTDRNHKIIQDVNRADPDVVYLCDADDYRKGLCNGTSFDALMMWRGTTRAMRWDDYSKAAIRKMFEDQAEGCAVCFEETGNEFICAVCSGRVCIVCLLRQALDDKAIRRIRAGQPTVRYKCAECRDLSEMNVMFGYCSALSRLDEFSPKQREILLLLKRKDPEYLNKERTMKSLQQLKSKRFRNGCRVVLQGLKSRKEWNGKCAVIVGDKVVKNKMWRWPIKLVGGQQGSALLKECNMKKAVTYVYINVDA